MGRVLHRRACRGPQHSIRTGVGNGVVDM